MTKFKPLPFEWDDAYDIKITWKKPIRVEKLLNAAKTEDSAYFYKIITQKTNKKRLLYVGMTYYQIVHDRLNNPDHIINKLLKKYREEELYVVLGYCKNICGPLTENRIKEVESLLIFASQPPENKANKKKHKAKYATYIYNQGVLVEIPEEIYSGVTIIPASSL